MSYALQYGSALVIFVIVDLIWLGIVARDYYHRELSGLMAEKFNIGAAAAFYLMYPVGIVVFAVAPALASGAWQQSALAGAGIGLFAYATYDLTNLATLRQWPLRLSILDMAWGTVLTATAATGAFLITRALG